MTRLADWRQRLAAYLVETRAAHFRLGRHDCFLFALGALDAMTGSAHLPVFAGRYDTVLEGARIGQAVYGCATYRQLFRRLLAPASNPRPGDIALVPTELGVAGAILQRPGALYLVSDIGWTVAPTPAAAEFYRV